MIKDVLIKAFATKQFDDSITFDFSILDNKHCVFRFVFASTFFNIFLLQSNCVITIVNTISSFVTLENRFSLVRSKEVHDIFTHDLLARTHSEHFRRDDESHSLFETKRFKEEEQCYDPSSLQLIYTLQNNLQHITQLFACSTT